MAATVAPSCRGTAPRSVARHTTLERHEPPGSRTGSPPQPDTRHAVGRLCCGFFILTSLYSVAGHPLGIVAISQDADVSGAGHESVGGGSQETQPAVGDP